MADKNLEIQITTTANKQGADATQKALTGVAQEANAAAEALKKQADAHDQLNEATSQTTAGTDGFKKKVNEARSDLKNYEKTLQDINVKKGDISRSASVLARELPLLGRVAFFALNPLVGVAGALAAAFGLVRQAVRDAQAAVEVHMWSKVSSDADDATRSLEEHKAAVQDVSEAYDRARVAQDTYIARLRENSEFQIAAIRRARDHALALLEQEKLQKPMTREEEVRRRGEIEGKTQEQIFAEQQRLIEAEIRARSSTIRETQQRMVDLNLAEQAARERLRQSQEGVSPDAESRLRAMVKESQDLEFVVSAIRSSGLNAQSPYSRHGDVAPFQLTKEQFAMWKEFLDKHLLNSSALEEASTRLDEVNKEISRLIQETGKLNAVRKLEIDTTARLQTIEEERQRAQTLIDQERRAIQALEEQRQRSTTVFSEESEIERIRRETELFRARQQDQEQKNREEERHRREEEMRQRERDRLNEQFLRGTSITEPAERIASEIRGGSNATTQALALVYEAAVEAKAQANNALRQIAQIQSQVKYNRDVTG